MTMCLSVYTFPPLQYCQTRPAVPQWIAKHPEFQTSLITKWEAVVIHDDADVFDKLELFKECMYAAASIVRMKIRETGASSPVERMHWIRRAEHAVRKGDGRSLTTALTAIPEYAHLFDTDLCLIRKPEEFHRALESLNREHLDLEMQSLNLLNIPDEEKQKRRARLRKKLAAWSPRRKHIKSVTILNEQGHPMSSDADAAEEVRRTWEPVFNAPGGDQTLFNKFYDCVHQLDMNFEPLSPSKFHQLMRVNRSAAPGPDGICYSAWSNSGDYGGDILYNCYVAVISSHAPPQW